MNVEQRRELLQPLCDLARRAGEAILEVYRREDLEVEHKDDDSPLTAADRASHRVLMEGLGALPGGFPILSEEGVQHDYDERKGWQRYWLIDPLDGTKEFVKRNGEFTVNIALIEDGRPVIGVVYAPVLERCYYGADGIGAFLADGQGEQPIRSRAMDGHAMTVVVSRSHRGGQIDQLLERLPEHDTTSMGSSLKFCLVAAGEADLYPRFGPTSEWDTAAAQAVVEAAGGMVTDVQLNPLRYNTKPSLLNSDFLVFGDRAYDWADYLKGFQVEPR